MTYKYEAFFSYKRDPESDGWHETLKTKLQVWLRQELGDPDAKIFFDTEDIQTGDRWKEKIGRQLQQSKCIICIWSPLYFRSRYCVSEWQTFLQREGLYGRDLVVPASYHDGESFPGDALARQIADFSNYALTIPRFWDTQLAVEFESKIKAFAHALADKIKRAPPYDETFPLAETPVDQVATESTIGRIANN